MTDRRDAFETTDNEESANREALDGEPQGGWAGVPEALSDTVNRPAGPDYGASLPEDETPGSQGEIESGSEGDFGTRSEPS